MAFKQSLAWAFSTTFFGANADAQPWAKGTWAWTEAEEAKRCRQAKQEEAEHMEHDMAVQACLFRRWVSDVGGAGDERWSGWWRC